MVRRAKKYFVTHVFNVKLNVFNVKLNFKMGLFSSIFRSGDSILCKTALYLLKSGPKVLENENRQKCTQK